MEKRPTSRTFFTTRRPTSLDCKTWNSIEPIFRASRRAQRETGRFRFYPYLVEVFRTYKVWKDRGISKTMARHVAKAFNTPRRTSTSSVRTLIDATFSGLDSKQKSRWARALQFAALAKATPEQLPMLFKNYSGIAGCARLAAKQTPAKETYRDDWADEHSVEREERIAQRERARQVWS
jgi:hypothetical protein